MAKGPHQNQSKRNGILAATSLSAERQLPGHNSVRVYWLFFFTSKNWPIDKAQRT